MTSSTNGDKNRKNNGNYDVIHFEVVNTIVALIKEELPNDSIQLFQHIII